MKIANMKITKIFIYLVIVLVPINVFTQTTTVTGDYDTADFLGNIKDGVYKNNFFGFKINSPKELFLLNQDQITIVKEGGQEILKTQNERNNKLIEEAGQKEVILYAAAEKPFGAEKNSSLNISVRKQPSSQVTSEMVLTATKKLLLANPKIKLVQDKKNVNLGGENFSTIELQSKFNNQSINQKIFITMRKGYSLTFVLTYEEGESLQLFEKLIQSLSFTKR